MSIRFHHDYDKVFQLLLDYEREAEVRVFVVGGVVRDLLLQREPLDRDVDFLIEGSAEQAAEYLQSQLGGTLKVFPNFLTAKLLRIDTLEELHELDLAQSRKEVYPEKGKLPIVEAASVEEDLKRRDFTINAMAVALGDFSGIHARELPQKLLDPFSGLQDLQARRIRILHEASFEDDPTRLFRACRYLVRLDACLEEKTETSFHEACTGKFLSLLSPARIFTELGKIFEEKQSGACLRQLVEREVISSVDFLHDLIALAPGLEYFDTLGLSPWLKRRLGITMLFQLKGKEGFPWNAVGVGNKTLKKVEANIESSRSDASVKQLSEVALSLKALHKDKKGESEELLELKNRNLIVSTKSTLA